MEIARQAQISDRFTTAVSQLDDKSIDVRLGGLYALQRIMNDSHDDQPAVVNVLSAYIRTHSDKPSKPSPKSEDSSAEEDILAAVKLLGARNPKYDGSSGVDLRNTQLRGADLNGANLRHADLSGADLRETNLDFADLRDADLNGADLRDAFLVDSDLRRAQLAEADLRRAQLGLADLRGANLDVADLRGANLEWAKGDSDGARTS